MSKTLIIIPTYNEKDNIENIIKAVISAVPRADILVVDDSSPDGTAAIVRKLRKTNTNLHLLVRRKKEGLGKAYVAGFKGALKRGYEYIVSMDADFSHDPKILPAMLELAKFHSVVIGSRYICGGGIKGWDWKRQINSRGANVVTRLMLAIKPKDATAGYKVYSSKFLKKINLDNLVSSGYAFQVEMIFQAKEMGESIAEIPVTFTDRRVGESKIAGELMKSAKIVGRLFFERRTIKQAIKFMAIGFFNVFVDWGIYFILTRYVGLDIVISRIISSGTALVSSYFLNKTFTFPDSGENAFKQFTKFIIVNGMGLVWNNLLFAFLVNYIGIYDLYSLVITTVVVFFWNFTLSKIWAFGDK